MMANSRFVGAGPIAVHESLTEALPEISATIALRAQRNPEVAANGTDLRDDMVGMRWPAKQRPNPHRAGLSSVRRSF